MSFKRSFSRIDELRSTELFNKYLKADVVKGEVFLTVRKDEIHFYYKGGCLYKFNGTSFARDEGYEKYSQGGLNEYEEAKKQNENKHKNKSGLITERQLLDKLNKHTFERKRKTDVVVLDIEVRLNGSVHGDKKCDMVLLNTKTNELMFVEGKIFADKRVNVKIGFTPEVIEQVKKYTEAIKEQKQNIIEQYSEHVRIINDLFDTKYEKPKKLFETAKLLVYGMPEKPNLNGSAVMGRVHAELGENNVVWVHGSGELGIDTIWNALCK